MGVDTKGRLKGYIKPEEIMNLIRQRIDKNVSSDVKFQNYGKIEGYEGDWIVESGFIYFKGKDDNRMLSYYHSNQIDKSNYDYYCEKGLKEIVETETTSISLECNDEAKGIIKAIVTEFGGWYDENDCDDIEYEPIIKNADGAIKPVFHITMNDIYNKFGGIVIIDK